MAEFIDATIILGFITRDDPDKTDRCISLLDKVRIGEITLITSWPAISKVIYSLISARAHPLGRDQIRSLLVPLLSIPGIKLRNKKSLLRALDLYVILPVEFEDAVCLADMERLGVKSIYSFNPHFEGIENISRIEPG